MTHPHTDIAKRILRSVAIMASGLVLAVSASGFVYQELPRGLDGSMAVYDFSACDPVPNASDSLQAVYASYVARHGARYLSGPSKVENLKKTLQAADAAGNLSGTGKRLLKLVDEIYDSCEDKWGALSAVGVEEENRLADRMHQMLPGLSPRKLVSARVGNTVNALSSYVPRVVATMYTFTQRLVDLDDMISVATDEGPQYDGLLRCFSADAAYAKYRDDGDWRDVYDEFVREKVPAAPAARLFTRAKSFTEQQLKSLSLEMYEVLKANRAYGMPAPTTEWMTREEYRACWSASNLQHYLRNSITPLSDLAAKATAPLLEKIISNADSALAASPMEAPTVDAYFGHAETLLPLLALMRVHGCYALPLRYEDLSNTWRVEDITPLGANLVILYYKSPTGVPYVAMQLNGHNVPPLPRGNMIVKWSALREYWQHILNPNQ